MNVQRFSLVLLSLFLLAGCSKSDQGGATASPAPAVGTPSVIATSPAATGTPPLSSEVLKSAYSLDVSSLTELPEGITKVADQKGRADQALAFSGATTKLEMPWDINAERHSQLTITAWARFTGNPEDKAQFQVVSQDDGGYDRSIGIDTRAGEWGWSAFAGEGEVMGGIPVVPNEWVFLAVAYDQGKRSSQLTVGESAVPAREGSLGAGHAFVWIGGNPSFGEHFVGDIAHVQVFDRVLTDEELKTVREQ